jgi:hypothetical protein
MRYINDPDSQQGLPPFYFPGMQARCFLLEARLDALASYCDNYLNVFPRFRFSPIAPVVYLAINNYPKMISEYPGARELGYSMQQEFTLSFPAVIIDNDDPDALPRPTWIFPFLGVDNSTSAFSGQEVLGFAKLLGDVGFEDSEGGFRSTVRMPGFVTFAPDHREQLHTLIEVEASGAAAHEPGQPGHGAAFDLLIDLFEDAAAAWIELIDPGMMSVTNLLQLRDGASPLMAGYSALVHCQWNFENFREPKMFTQSEVRFYPIVTAEIVDLLGLAVEEGILLTRPSDGMAQPATRPGVRIRPKLAWGFTADMRFSDIEHLATDP